MIEVIRLFKQIQKTSSLNEKKSIIQHNKDNTLFRRCLKFLLDDNIITGISTKKIGKKLSTNSMMTSCHLNLDSTFEDVIDYLEKNNTGKDDDLEF